MQTVVVDDPVVWVFVSLCLAVAGDFSYLFARWCHCDAPITALLYPLVVVVVITVFSRVVLLRTDKDLESRVNVLVQQLDSSIASSQQRQAQLLTTLATVEMMEHELYVNIQLLKRIRDQIAALCDSGLSADLSAMKCLHEQLTVKAFTHVLCHVVVTSVCCLQLLSYIRNIRITEKTEFVS